MIWLGPSVSPAGITFDLTEVIIAIIAGLAAASGGWALVRKARIEAESKAGERELNNQKVWEGIVNGLRSELERVSETAEEARTQAAAARQGEAECNERNRVLRVEFDAYRDATDARIADLEQQAGMVPVLQGVIQSLTLDAEERADLIEGHTETLDDLSGRE